LPGEVGETLERISPEILHLEQHVDFVRNRQFGFLHEMLVSSPSLPEAKAALLILTGRWPCVVLVS